jgi:hypothetical protein
MLSHGFTAFGRRTLGLLRHDRRKPSRPAGMRTLPEMQFGGDQPRAAPVDIGAPCGGRALRNQRARGARRLLALDRRHGDCPVHDPDDSGQWPSSPRWSRCWTASSPAGGTAPRRAARLLFLRLTLWRRIRRRIALSDYQNVKATRQSAKSGLIRWKHRIVRNISLFTYRDDGFSCFCVRLRGRLSR